MTSENQRANNPERRMHYPQILVFESDGRLGRQLGDLAQKNKWVLREPRQLENCLRLLRAGGPGVLVVKVGRNLQRELTLVQRTAWLFPETAVVVVGDTEDRVLAGLAWDLGASYVLFPPQPRDLLPSAVEGLMKAAAPQTGTAEGRAAPRGQADA